MNIKTEVLLVVPIRPDYSGITIDLGLLYLYSALKDHGIDSTILHCPKDQIDHNEWREILRINSNLKIIGFKCYSTDHNSVKRMSADVKEIRSEAVTIVGGPHVTSLPEYVLKDMPAIDFVFYGEGEIGFPIFCQEILNGGSPHGVPSLIYRVEDKIRRIPQQIVEDLDHLPRIRWEDFEVEEYPNFMTSLPFIPVMATRGCPFPCTYCATPNIVGRKMRFRSAKNVVDELDILKNEKNIKGFSFSDDELTLNKKFLYDLCNEIIDRDLDLSWECSNGVRLDTIDEETLELMHKAGCCCVSIGIESASNEILERVKKKINIETIRERTKIIKKSKIVPQGLFMIGFPGETEEQINNTIDFSIELGIDKTNFSIFMPLPGTETFDDMIRDGWLKLDEINWDDMRPDRTVFERPGCSSERLRKLQKKAYFKFYIRPKPLKRLIREFILQDGGIKSLVLKIKSVFLSK